MNERLSDEQVAEFTNEAGRDLALEVQAWRTLVNGGPCETCGGRGEVEGMNHTPGSLLFPCPNCTDGTRPGLIARLEAAFVHLDDCQAHVCRHPAHAERIAILAELRTVSP